MPAPVHDTKAADIKESGGQTQGMIRQNAIVDVSDKVCASGKTTSSPCFSCAIDHNLLSDSHDRQAALQLCRPPPRGSRCVHNILHKYVVNLVLVYIADAEATVKDTIVYAAKGQGTVVSEGGEKRQDLTPGDFALIPGFAEHQEVNDSNEDVVWIITRSGKRPIVENLEGWGKG